MRLRKEKDDIMASTFIPRFSIFILTSARLLFINNILIESSENAKKFSRRNVYAHIQIYLAIIIAILPPTKLIKIYKNWEMMMWSGWPYETHGYLNPILCHATTMAHYVSKR